MVYGKSSLNVRTTCCGLVGSKNEFTVQTTVNVKVRVDAGFTLNVCGLTGSGVTVQVVPSDHVQLVQRRTACMG